MKDDPIVISELVLIEYTTKLTRSSAVAKSLPLA